MTLITKGLTEQLLANGRAQRAAIDKGNGVLDIVRPLRSGRRSPRTRLRLHARTA
jgi:hypothetical protein